MDAIYTIITSIGITMVILYSTLIIAIVFIAIPTALMGLIKHRIGQKAGIGSHWRAYVPVFADLYTLEYAKRPWWNVFFFGTSSAIFFAIIVFLLGLLAAVNAVLSVILVVVFAIFQAIATLLFTAKFYISYFRLVNIDVRMTVFCFIPIVPVSVLIDTLVGFTSLFKFSASREKVNEDNGAYNAHSVLGISGMYNEACFKAANNVEIIFGRDAAVCNVVFDDRAKNAHISRQHCVIKFVESEAKYYVTDKSSTGTYKADGTKLPAHMSVAVAAGTEIYLGSKDNSFKLQ